MNAQSYVEYYNQGHTAFNNGDYSGFLENLIKADSARPNHRVILFSLAKAYSVNEKKELALETLEKLVSFYASEAILDSVNFKNLVHHDGWPRLAQKVKSANMRISNSELAFEIEAAGVHLEGIEYDPQNQSFYLTDIRSGKVYITNKEGSNLEVLLDVKSSGYWAPMNVKIDPLDNKKLWVVSSAVNILSDYDESQNGNSVLLLINKKTGEIIEEYFPPEGGHLFGDLVVSTNGDVYVTDSQMPKVYKMHRKSGLFAEAFSYKDWWNLQGIVLSEDERRLYISDYITGIFLIDLVNGQVSPLLPNNELLRSTDGLYIKENRLIAIQNGTLPKRISVIHLDEEGMGIGDSITYLDQDNELLEEPTLGTWVNGDLYYIGNSPWGYYEDNNPKLGEWPVLKIMKLKGSKI